MAHSRIFKDHDPDSRTFQGLEIFPPNSRTFQDIQGLWQPQMNWKTDDVYHKVIRKEILPFLMIYMQTLCFFDKCCDELPSSSNQMSQNQQTEGKKWKLVVTFNSSLFSFHQKLSNKWSSKAMFYSWLDHNYKSNCLKICFF